MTEISTLITKVQQGDTKSLARAITIVENNLNGSEELLQALTIRNIPLIGITGPPGAGKSSILSSLIGFLLKKNFKVGVISVDPTSPFNFGSLLGDRIRMAEHFNNENVFIRSLASRGSLGGLTDSIIEVSDVMKAASFDFVFVETVGVGQSEVEIAGLADTTIVVLVPEAGDEIQTMKAGLMEIADIFVVNKADHVDADRFAKNLKVITASKMKADWETPVIKTIATQNEGIEELLQEIENHNAAGLQNERRAFLLTEKAWRIIEKEKMKSLDKKKLFSGIQAEMKNESFNLYRFAKNIMAAKPRSFD